MLEREEGNPPTKPSELAKTKSASHDETVAPSEFVIRASTARAASSVSRARSIAASTDRPQGWKRSSPGASPRKRRSASGSPAAWSGAVCRAMAHAASTACAIDRFREVRRARVAAPLAEIDGHRERLVAVVLDGLHRAQPHGHGLADGGGGLGLGVARAARAGERQGAKGGGFERGAIEGQRRGGGHVGHVRGGNPRGRFFARAAAKTSKLRRARRASDRRSTTR